MQDNGSTGRKTKGERAIFAIKEAGFTVEMAAEKMGKNPATLYRWASGESSPYDSSLQDVAKLTGFSFHWLKEGEGPQKGAGATARRKPRPVRQHVEGMAATAHGDPLPEGDMHPPGSVVIYVDGEPYLVYTPRFVGTQRIDLDRDDFIDRFIPGRH